MNVFEFLKETINFARQGFLNWVTTVSIISVVGIFAIACLEAISNFKLFSIKKNDNVPTGPLNSSQQTSQFNPNHNKVYDMLINAWERRKTKGNRNKGE
tara:strand:- start:5199 stop:5495 length:297 start_codon:yes stop_codon:yes gene_type:complete